jgi:hypothetical protein
MPEFVCPLCHAAIDPDLLTTVGQVDCPFCAADLSSLCSPADATDSKNAEEIWVDDPDQTRRLPPIPKDSKIKVIESHADRLVLYIPGGGMHARGIGCFAVLWNGFMCLFTVPALAGLLRDEAGNAPPFWGIAAFLGVFWAVGLGMACFWLKMTYGRTFVLLERQRLVVQYVLFSRKRVQETLLLPDSRAELVESYQQNDTPVYRIEIRGKDKTGKFGTALSPAEKDWIVDRINEFLNVVSVPVVAAAAPYAGPVAIVPNSCPKCGAPLTGSAIDGMLNCMHCGAVARAEILVRNKTLEDARYVQLEPADLPAGSRVQIDENSVDALEFHYAAVGTESGRWLIPIVAVPCSLAAFGCGGFASLIGWVFPLLLVAVGLVLLAIGGMAFWGQTTVRLKRDTLECRWHVANLGKTLTVSTREIDTIRVEKWDISQQNPRVRGAAQSSAPVSKALSCLVHAGSRRILLSLLQEETLLWQVASLLRTRLQKMGYALRDA